MARGISESLTIIEFAIRTDEEGAILIRRERIYVHPSDAHYTKQMT